jgi:uncharacterized protein (TIGR01777 family)
MKVVVAGASGLIGRALCTELAQRGHRPVVLSRNPRRRAVPAARVVAWRPPGRGDWGGELAGAGAVINLAGESVGRWPWTPARRRALRESRIVATRTIVDALAEVPTQARPPVLVNASGTDLYEGRDDEPADEETPPTTTFLARLCVDWEAAARRAEDVGTRVVLARTSLVIADGAPSLRLLSLPFRLFLGGRVGSGQQWMSWIDIGDAVGLMIRAIESDELAGPVNLSAPDPRRQVDFARALAAALHRPSWFPTPAFAIRLALGQQATLALGSRRVWPARALGAGYRFMHPALEESLALRVSGRPGPA